MIAILIAGTFGNVVGNFIYQMIKEKPDYKLAADRSWFQVIIVLQIIMYLHYK